MNLLLEETPQNPPNLFVSSKYRRWESNPYFRGNAILNRARLPIPPRRPSFAESDESLQIALSAVKSPALRFS